MGILETLGAFILVIVLLLYWIHCIDGWVYEANTLFENLVAGSPLLLFGGFVLYCIGSFLYYVYGRLT